MKRSKIKPKTTRKCAKHGIYSLYNTLTKCPQCIKEKQNGTNKGIIKRRVKPISLDLGRPEQNAGKINISKRSSKKQEEDRKVLAIKKKLIEEHGSCCMSCGAHGPVDASHLLPRSLRPDLVTHPLNVILHCRWCHLVFEARDIEKIAKFKNLGDILKRLRQLDYGRYEKIISKLREHNI